MIFRSSKVSIFDAEEWLHNFTLYKRRICFIRSHDKNFSTSGFLIGEDIIITSFHGIDKSIDPKNTSILFDHTSKYNTKSYSLAEDYLLHINEELDYILIKMKGKPGRERGWCDRVSKTVVGDDILTLHHPYMQPLKFSFAMDGVVAVEKERFFHTADTVRGSAGAPCFNANWELIGIHQGYALYGGKRLNQGVLFSRIRKDLQEKQLLSEMKRSLKKRFSFRQFQKKEITSETLYPAEESVKKLISGGENQTVEFKETACRDFKTGNKSKASQFKIKRSVAGFMNSRNESALFIGIQDATGLITGVENDYSVANKQKSNRDGHQLLVNSILENLDTKNAFEYYDIEYVTVQGKEVCVVWVKPAVEPVFLNDKFFLRVDNRTIELKGRKVIAYIDKRWGGSVQQKHSR